MPNQKSNAAKATTAVRHQGRSISKGNGKQNKCVPKVEDKFHRLPLNPSIPSDLHFYLIKN